MPTTNFASKYDFLKALRERVDISVQTLDEMYALKTFVRKWSMIVGVWNDPEPNNNGLYMLKYGKASTIISDNNNWNQILSARLHGVILGGSVSWTGVGLNFAVGYTEYYFYGNLWIIAVPVPVECEVAHPTLARFDAFYVDNTGNAGVITGVPSEDPLVPVVDPDSQIFLTSVLIGPGATVPTVDMSLIYDENVEWTPSFSGNLTVVFDRTLNPSKGTIHARASNVKGNDIIVFTAPANVDSSLYQKLEFDLDLLATMNNRQNIHISLLLDGVAVGNEVLCLVSKGLLAYQTISVNMSDLTSSTILFNGVRIRWVRTGGPDTTHSGFDLDYVRMTAGLPPVIFVDTIELAGETIGSGTTGYPINTKLNEGEAATTLDDTDTFVVRISGVLRKITWQSLLTLIGGSGTDGRTPELRIDSGWVQWKYTDEVDWNNLFEIPADGADGADGLPGADGTDGASAFVYIAYASDDTGTDFTLTFDPALNYIAIKATTTEIVTPVVGDFAGLWKNYKGADGSGGETDLPIGLEGQIYKITEDATNDVEPQDNVLVGNYIETDEELTIMQGITFPGFDEVFNDWLRFSHGTYDPVPTAHPGAGNDLPACPAATQSWNYDAVNDRINLTLNSGSYVGFISPDMYEVYSIKATIGATTVNDNDTVALVLAFVEDYNDMVLNRAYGLNPASYPGINCVDEYIPNQHTLTLMRQREVGVDFKYSLIYNYNKSDQKILVNGHSLVWETTANWPAVDSCDIKAVRVGNIVKIYTTEFVDSPTGKGALSFELTFDLSSDPVTQKFRGPSRYGFSARSQPNACWSNVVISMGNIYDVRNGDVWEFDGTSWAINGTTILSDLILQRSLLYNSYFKKLFWYVNPAIYYRINLGEAPLDGKTYGRKDGAWAEVEGGYEPKKSIQLDDELGTEDNKLQLVGDALAPGNSKYYGTDGAGAKGFHDLPAGGSTPQYNPINTVVYYDDGKVKQVKTDIGGGLFIDKRVEYATTGDEIGKASLAEIKDESVSPALWKSITYNYTDGVLTSTTVADIVAWTITI